MPNVYVEPRPKGRPEGSHIEDFVVEDHADHILASFKTQRKRSIGRKARGTLLLSPGPTFERQEEAVSLAAGLNASRSSTVTLALHSR
jgi:hypothetical protein